jgi:hypothetical protein
MPLIGLGCAAMLRRVDAVQWDAAGSQVLRADALFTHSFLLLLSRHLRAFFSGFRQADGDRLLSAFHRASFAAGARFQRAPLLAAHCAGNGF